MDPAERVDHVRDVLVGVRRGKREGEHLCAGPLGYGKQRLAGQELAVRTQRVHGEEVDARRDVLLGEQRRVVVAPAARALRVDSDDVEVERMQVTVVTAVRTKVGAKVRPGDVVLTVSGRPLMILPGAANSAHSRAQRA